MKLKNFIIPVLAIGLILGSFTIPSLASQETQEQEREFIPKEIKSILTEGIDSRTPRTDIPIDIFKYLYLPTSTMENLHMSSPPESGTPEQELRYHTYLGHVIPWYVRLIWVIFWIFAIGYAISYFLPAIQTELLTPP